MEIILNDIFYIAGDGEATEALVRRQGNFCSILLNNF